MATVTHRTQVYPAPDVPGQWVAHDLDLDVVTQGNSEEHAREMLREACAMVVADDLSQGRDPMARRLATSHTEGAVDMKTTLTFKMDAARAPGEPRLSPADVPIGCTVERASDTLTLSIHYWAGTEEPIVALNDGDDRVGIGVFSHRLFRVTIKVSPGRAATDVAADLTKLFQKLLESAPQPGTRLNYETAWNQLELSVTTPPEWLTEMLVEPSRNP